MSSILKGLTKEALQSPNFDQQIKNITRQNPKGSAAEQILLGKFLNSDQGAYARNVLGKNHKGWIEHIATWLKKNQPRLEKEFNELDFSDLTSLAYDMYENYLAKQGQLEEDQAPMFTPESDDKSDLKKNALKVMYDTVMAPLRGTKLYPTNVEDFKKIAAVSLQELFSKRYNNLSRQQIVPASQKMAEDMVVFFNQEAPLSQMKKVSGIGYNMRESSIMKGLLQD